MAQKSKRIPCPHCSELILPTAQKCRFCGEWLHKRKLKIKIRTGKRKFFFVLVILGILSGYWIINKYFARNNFSTPNNELGLRQTLNRQHSLLDTADGVREIYRNYLAPESKTFSEEEYVSKFLDKNKSQGITHSKVDIHSVNVSDNIGYVDRTLYECADVLCTNVISTNRMFRKYVYFSGKWLMSTEYVLCPRTKMYSMNPEFERAVKLILQRTSNPTSIYQDVINCVNIKYSDNDSEMEGAEGAFYFQEGQAADNLEILVSPRYSIKDDLITAILLVHEISHATNYANDLASGEKSDCYRDEAVAFNNQNWFITLLNKEEQDSVFARASLGGSQELQNIMYVWNTIPKFQGETFLDKAENFVKSNPAYVEQCSNRNN